MSIVRVAALGKYSRVPDETIRLLVDKGQLEALGLHTSLLARGNRWEFHVWQVMREHHLSQYKWERLRDQLKAAGLLQQRRIRSKGGTWVWELVVFDAPFDESSPKKPQDDLSADIRTDDKQTKGDMGATARAQMEDADPGSQSIEQLRQVLAEFRKALAK